MGINVRVRNGITVMEVVGDMRIGHEDVELRQGFVKLIEEGRRAFVLNLSRVGYMDSAAIGETVACHKRALGHGGSVKLVLVPSGKPEDILKITSLDRVFEIFHNEDEAVQSFDSPRAVV